MAFTYAASSIAGSFYPFTLAAGDTGVRSIQSVTLGVSMSSGTVHLVAYRVLASIGNGGQGFTNTLDVMTSGMPMLYDNTVPFLIFIPSTTTTTTSFGMMSVTQG